MIKRFIGTGVALVTPFDRALRVDFRGLKRLLNYTTDSEVRYLVVHGTTGEAATTTPEEKAAILAFVQAHNPNNLPIVYGIGGNNTHELIKTIRNTNFQGIDAVLSASPHYNRPSQEGIYQHYRAIAEVCPVPILLYNIPVRTGSNITATTTLRLSEHPNIIGIKEASGNLLQCIEIAKGKDDDFLLISGDDMLTLPMMAIGAVGVISVIANGFPKKMAHITNLVLQRRDEEAQSHVGTLLPVNRLIGQESNPVGIKQLLAVLGICQKHVRLPLVSAPTSLARRMRTVVLQGKT
ncbi:MAG: 4-hydroxy-tetrahydrodipicolinate synthase [Amoebophilaceae bacterium]|jgi:4-hydroxy-tetrahydrodipicolinate synthase|nr:4-hydroxy-tetrahydrodipicolinate synthase [Amoebophilaceae bacterium]